MLNISVVIPVYNSAQHIVESLESVLNQTFKVFEVIVINDGSTDNLLDTLSPYWNQIIYFEQENLGVSAARNKGIKEAKGSWIAFIDADDIWCKNKIEKQITSINSDVGFIYCNKICFDEIEKNEEKERYKTINNKVPAEMFFTHWVASPSTVIVRVDILRELKGFNEDLRTNEDEDLWIRIASKNIKFIHIKDFLVKYRIRKGSLSHSLDAYQSALSFIYPLELNRKLIQKSIGWTSYGINFRIGTVYGYYIKRLFLGKQFKNAFKLAKRLFFKGFITLNGCLAQILFGISNIDLPLNILKK